MKPGDVVQLKSGDPVMTIERLYRGGNNEERASCHWFDEGKEKTGTFAVAALKPA